MGLPKEYIRQVIHEELEKRDSLYRDVHNTIQEFRREIQDKSDKFLNEEEDEKARILEAELKTMKRCVDKLNEAVFEEKENGDD